MIASTKQNKLELEWTGIYEVIGTVNDYVYTLRSLDDEHVTQSHIKDIKRYHEHGKFDNMTLERYKELTRYYRRTFEIENIIDITVTQQINRRKIKYIYFATVKWKYHDDTTDESVRNLIVKDRLLTLINHLVKKNWSDNNTTPPSLDSTQFNEFLKYLSTCK